MRPHPTLAAAVCASALALASLQLADGAHAVSVPTDPSAAIAALNGLSQSQLVDILAHDSTAHLGFKNHLYYIDPAPAHPAAASHRQAAVAGGTTYSLPVLNSRPSSTHVIYLDFTGTTVGPDDAWVDGGLHPGHYSGFNLSGSASTYTQAEVSYIKKVWRIVAEKYSTFDVNVTTVDPGIDGYTRSDSTDTHYGDQVVITNDPDAADGVCAGSCAGSGFISSFDLVPDAGSSPDAFQPAWVFPENNYGSAQMTGDDAAHEIGHTLGLTHDGTNAGGDGSYYFGQANWVPIMGASDRNAVVQFSKGEYAGANNQQDDLAIIGQNGNSGAPNSLLLPDDFTTSNGSPTGAAVLGSRPSYSVSGMISNAADDDLFSIARTCTKALTAKARGIGIGQALDIRVSILNASNQVLASNNPVSGQNKAVQPDGDTGYRPTGLNATATLSSPSAGSTYRIRVDGVGSGSPVTDGYSSYGSIGRYRLVISGCPGKPSAPKIGTAQSGSSGGAKTATVRWGAPASTGGAAITRYTVLAYKLFLGSVIGTYTSPAQPGSARSFAFTLPSGTYQFRVIAYNSVGASPGSAYSNTVIAR